jgi:hypothetical protein
VAAATGVPDCGRINILRHCSAEALGAAVRVGHGDPWKSASRGPTSAAIPYIPRFQSIQKTHASSWVPETPLNVLNPQFRMPIGGSCSVSPKQTPACAARRWRRSQ